MLMGNDGVKYGKTPFLFATEGLGPYITYVTYITNICMVRKHHIFLATNRRVHGTKNEDLMVRWRRQPPFPSSRGSPYFT